MKIFTPALYWYRLKFVFKKLQVMTNLNIKLKKTRGNRKMDKMENKVTVAFWDNIILI